MSEEGKRRTQTATDSHSQKKKKIRLSDFLQTFILPSPKKNKKNRIPWKARLEAVDGLAVPVPQKMKKKSNARICKPKPDNYMYCIRPRCGSPAFSGCLLPSLLMGAAAADAAAHPPLACFQPSSGRDSKDSLHDAQPGVYCLQVVPRPPQPQEQVGALLPAQSPDGSPPPRQQPLEGALHSCQGLDDTLL
jgi:hypothetical protein